MNIFAIFNQINKICFYIEVKYIHSYNVRHHSLINDFTLIKFEIIFIKLKLKIKQYKRDLYYYTKMYVKLNYFKSSDIRCYCIYILYIK